MSKMLEQAIIDAEALREAALQNAEQAIIEKYSSEVKEAVNQILEQPEEEALPLGGEVAPDEGAVAPEGEFADVARADMDGDDLCPCPDEGDDIEIDLMAIARELETDQEKEKVSRDAVVDIQPEEGEEEEEEEELVGLSEDFEIPDEFIDHLLEKLSFNTHPVPSGVPGGGTNITTEREIEDVVKARMAVEELEDSVNEEEEAQESFADQANSERPLVKVDSKQELELTEQIENLTNQRNNLVQENNEIKSLLLKAKVKLQEVNLTNAQLYYTNKVLGSTSLNERQKNTIVESLSNTSTVEETKIIYETLQSSVGQDVKSRPQSLSEVVSRPSAVIPRREEKVVKDTVSNRWKALAGIDKKR